MSKSFKDFATLFKHIKKDSSRTLKKEVAPTITNEMSQTIKEVTYKQYTPTLYERTGELANVKNMQVEIIDNNTIVITNERSDGGRDVARVVAEGLGYTWENSKIYKMQPFERNFYEDTVERLNGNGKHVEAMRKGLISMGYTVK
ncbi:hypothetical protein EBB07_29550 [Paenibacillaceae bacterium]|nr:hypothetical protein EBB07_29550 [Paenibacillaceae bacterium]